MAGPKGFTPSRSKYAGYNTGGRQRFLIKNGYANNLAKGDPVKVSNGFVKIAANGATVKGVFDGCKYIDPTLLRSVETDIWFSGTSSGGSLEGTTQALGYVIPAEGNKFFIPADASVSASLVGQVFPVSVGTASTQYKRSGAVMNVSAQVSNDKNMVRVVGFSMKVGDGPDTIKTLVEVEFVTTGFTYA